MEAPRTFMVCNMPTQADAATGYVYVNPKETQSPYIMVDDKYIYRCAAHPDIKPGWIGMNAIQRRLVEKVASESTSVKNFYVPMDKNIVIDNLVLEVDFLKDPPVREYPDRLHLADAFRARFSGHILIHGQKVVMEYIDNTFLFEVKSETFGLVGEQTHIEFVRV